MNFFKKIKLPFSNNKNINYYTLFTGSHLKYTQELIQKLSIDNPQTQILVLNKFFTKNEEKEGKNDFNFDTSIIDPLENVQIFNCDTAISEDTDELTHFFQSNQFKIKNVIHSDHFISCLDHSQKSIFPELKMMTQVNIENAMLLNSKLLSAKILEIDSKIFHLKLPNTKNLEAVPNFLPNRMLGQSLKHMVNCCKEDLIKNPVFFSLINIDTFDNEYQHRFENNKTIPTEDLEKYKTNYTKSIMLINKLLSNKLSGLDFGKKFWSLDDLNNLNKI